ncbi:Uncharacterised protein [uncultured archaeon]|nr:Uncharacterised protein [uncultured archaeon]
MRARPAWSRMLIKNHVVKHEPKIRKRKRRIGYSYGEAGEYLLNLLQKSDPKAKERLVELSKDTNPPAHIPMYRRGVDLTKSVVFTRKIYNPKFLAWEKRRHAQRDAWLRSYLEAHPEIRKKYLAEIYRTRTKETFYGQTWVRRLEGLDAQVLQIIRKKKLKPTSFLDVGAAFVPYTPEQKGPNAVPAQTTVEAKRFFRKARHNMQFWAVDVAPLDKKIQLELLKRGVLALQQDYRARPLSRKFSIIRLANVSVNQSPQEFSATISNLVQSLEPNGLLVIHNEVSRPLGGFMEMCQIPGFETGIYQKIVTPKGVRLEKIHYEKKEGMN